jgi:hypothetical protein
MPGTPVWSKPDRDVFFGVKPAGLGYFLPMLTAAVIVLVAFIGAQQNVLDLDTVVARATSYVAQYEADLGNLIGTEQYVQNSV